MKTVTLVKTTQVVKIPGEVRVTSLVQVVDRAETLVALMVGLVSHFAVIEGTGRFQDDLPAVALGAGDRTTDLVRSRRGECTILTFPEFEGWDVHSAEICNANLCVCLIKKEY